MEAEMMKQVHAVLARSTFGSQKCEKLTVSDHFWRRLATSEQNVGVLQQFQKRWQAWAI